MEQISLLNFEEWLQKYSGNRIYRMLKLRRIGDYTPYEQENKFGDTDQYYDNTYKMVKIREAIKLPDNDILLGLEDADETDLDENSPKVMDYLKLSQIELSYFEYDQEDYVAPDDEENETEESWFGKYKND